MGIEKEGNFIVSAADVIIYQTLENKVNAISQTSNFIMAREDAL